MIRSGGGYRGPVIGDQSGNFQTRRNMDCERRLGARNFAPRNDVRQPYSHPRLMSLSNKPTIPFSNKGQVLDGFHQFDVLRVYPVD